MSSARDTVMRVITQLVPEGRGESIGENSPLGNDGLGFDSVRLVELLLSCEEALGVTLPAEELPGGAPLTVGAIVGWIEARVAARAGGAKA